MSLPPELAQVTTETMIAFCQAALADAWEVFYANRSVTERDAAKDRIDVWDCILGKVMAHGDKWADQIDAEERDEIQSALDCGDYDDVLREV